MSARKRHKIISRSQIKPFEDGQMNIVSNSGSQMEGIEDTSYLPKTKPKSSTVESPPTNKSQISGTKLNSCKNGIRTMKSSTTSQAASTLREKDFSPFYNESSKTMFQKLWLAPTIDSPDLTMNSLNGFLNNSDVSSFVLTEDKENLKNRNYLKTLWQSLQSLLPDPIENEDIIATRKIRIFPNEKQFSLFGKCFGTTRYLYNKTLDAIKEAYETAKRKLRRTAKRSGCVHMVKQKATKAKGSKKAKDKPEPKQCCDELSTKFFCKKHEKMTPKYGVPINFQHWRNIIIKRNADLSEDEKWLSEIPFDTRQLVIKSLIGAYKSGLTNLRKGNIKTFNIKFKSKRDKNQFFFVDHRALNKDRILWPNILGDKLKMRKGEEKWFHNHVEENDLKDMIITREYPGKYYLHIPYIKEKLNTEAPYSTVSIDPGVRTFHTFYNPEGEVGKIGDGLATKLMKMQEKISDITSKISKTNTSNNDDTYEENKKKRQRMRKQCAWLKTKARNIVNDHHWKAASYYCKNYENIIIPKLDVKSLQKLIKKTFNLKKGSKMIQKMMILAHCRMVDILIYKAQQYRRNVFVVDEHYTSKTCGGCGALHPKLGKSEVYDCRYCHKKFDRDVNGARNILIKTLSKTN